MSNDENENTQKSDIDRIVNTALHSGTAELSRDENAALSQSKDALPLKVQDTLAFRRVFDEKMAAHGQLERASEHVEVKTHLLRSSYETAIAANALVSGLSEIEGANPDKVIDGLPKSIREDYELIATVPSEYDNSQSPALESSPRSLGQRVAGFFSRSSATAEVDPVEKKTELFEIDQKDRHEAENPNRDIENIKESLWTFSDDGSRQFRILTGTVKVKEGFIPGIERDGSEWPAFDRDAPHYSKREHARAHGFDKELADTRSISDFSIDDFIDPKNPPIVSGMKPSEPEPKNGKIIDQFFTKSVERIDGSNIAFGVGRLSGTEDYIRGFSYQGPDMEHMKPENVWDNDKTFKTPEKALEKAPEYQKDFQRKYEEDIDMAAEKGVADVIMEGIKNIKNPVRRAEAMKLAGKMAVQSAVRKNENDRTATTNRAPRAQEREVSRGRERDRDIEVDR